MKRIAVEIPLRIPDNLCREYIRKSVRNESFKQAYSKLRSGKMYPGDIVEENESQIIIYEPAFDPTVGSHGLFNTGWKIIYTFTPEGGDRTLVEIAIEYNRMTAVLGLGFIRVQAQGELLHLISRLIAFEEGLTTQLRNHAERLLGATQEDLNGFNRSTEEPIAIWEKRRNAF